MARNEKYMKDSRKYIKKWEESEMLSSAYL